MRKKLVAIGAGMTLLLGGCTTSNEQSGPATTEAPTSAEAPSELTEGAQVENIFGDRLAVSSSPYETTHTLVGYWAAGQLALGKCLAHVSESPNDTKIFVEVPGGDKSIEGYASTWVDFTKEGPQGDMISPSLAELEKVLPECNLVGMEV